MNSLVIGLNAFNSPQWEKCKEHLLKIPKIETYCVQNYFDKVNTHPLKRIDALYSRASFLVPGSVSKKPIICEMFDCLSSIGGDFFFFINSDVVISNKAIKWMIEQKDYTCACFSRCDYNPNSITNYNNWIPYGFDGFYVNSQWWKENRSLFLDTANIYSEAYWDSAYSTIMHMFSSCYFFNKRPLIYHISHKQRWSQNSLEGKWNNSRFFGIPRNLWNIYMSKVIYARKNIKTPISFTEEEAENRLEKEIFRM